MLDLSKSFDSVKLQLYSTLRITKDSLVNWLKSTPNNRLISVVILVSKTTSFKTTNKELQQVLGEVAQNQSWDLRL